MNEQETLRNVMVKARQLGVPLVAPPEAGCVHRDVRERYTPSIPGYICGDCNNRVAVMPTGFNLVQDTRGYARERQVYERSDSAKEENGDQQETEQT